MRYLIMLILPLTLLLTVGCEEDEVDKCNDLTTTVNDAVDALDALLSAEADSLALVAGCADWVDAYEAALDGACDEFTQEELDNLEEFCGN